MFLPALRQQLQQHPTALRQQPLKQHLVLLQEPLKQPPTVPPLSNHSSSPKQYLHGASSSTLAASTAASTTSSIDSATSISDTVTTSSSTLPAASSTQTSVATKAATTVPTVSPTVSPAPTSSPAPTMHPHTAWPISEACWYVFVKLKFHSSDSAKISWKIERFKEDGSGWSSVILSSVEEEHTQNPEDFDKLHCIPMGEYKFTIMDDEGNNGLYGPSVEYAVTTNDLEVIAEGQNFGTSESTSFPLPTEKMQESRF
eukprot:986063_1